MLSSMALLQPFSVAAQRTRTPTFEPRNLHSFPPSTSSSSIQFFEPSTSLFSNLWNGPEQSFASWRSSRQLEQLQGYKSWSPRPMRRRRGGLTVKALQGAGRSPRRLVDVIRAIPRLSKTYFKSPFRRALYGGISLLGGFYVAQTISLSFGALGVNDVIAAAMCVLFAEYVTRFYYSRGRVTFILGLLNNFKMGFTYGLFIDAFKLAS